MGYFKDHKSCKTKATLTKLDVHIFGDIYLVTDKYLVIYIREIPFSGYLVMVTY